MCDTDSTISSDSMAEHTESKHSTSTTLMNVSLPPPPLSPLFIHKSAPKGLLPTPKVEPIRKVYYYESDDERIELMWKHKFQWSGKKIPVPPTKNNLMTFEEKCEDAKFQSYIQQLKYNQNMGTQLNTRQLNMLAAYDEVNTRKRKQPQEKIEKRKKMPFSALTDAVKCEYSIPPWLSTIYEPKVDFTKLLETLSKLQTATACA